MLHADFEPSSSSSSSPPSSVAAAAAAAAVPSLVYLSPDQAHHAGEVLLPAAAATKHLVSANLCVPFDVQLLIRNV
jgi:hypothetical protein